MIDTARLSQLASLGERAGGLLLIGDDRKLSSVERGGMFADIVAAVSAAADCCPPTGAALVAPGLRSVLAGAISR